MKVCFKEEITNLSLWQDYSIELVNSSFKYRSYILQIRDQKLKNQIFNHFIQSYKKEGIDISFDTYPKDLILIADIIQEKWYILTDIDTKVDDQEVIYHLISKNYAINVSFEDDLEIQDIQEISC